MKLINKITCSALLSYVFYILPLIVLLGCTESSHSPSETGSIAFNIEWEDIEIQEPESQTRKITSFRETAAIDCVSAGVSTVTFNIYDANNTYLVGNSWACSSHQGTVNGVSSGSNRKLVVLGKDSNGNSIYRGEVTGINVVANQTANAGTITENAFSPTLLTPVNNQTVQSINLSWQSVTGASSYQIQISTNSSFSSVLSDNTSTLTNFAPSISATEGTYYWRIKAKDNYNNESKWSGNWTFTYTLSPAGSSWDNMIWDSGNWG